MDKNKAILINNLIVQKVGLDATDMDGEIVMMDMDRGKYYCFNSVGSRIWRLIEKPMAVKDIIVELLKEFDVELETCQEEVLGFLGRLQNEELCSFI